MKTKDTVLIGAVVTTFLITVEMIWNLPSFAWAAFILVGGLLATYYAALSQKLGQEKEALKGLLDADKGLAFVDTSSEINDYYDKWIKQLIPCEKIFYYSQMKDMTNINLQVLTDWQEKMKRENRGLIIDKPEEIKKIGLDEKVKSLLALPVNGEDFIYCINSRQNAFTRYDLKVLEYLSDNVRNYKEGLIMSEEREKFYQSVISLLVDALEKNAPLFYGHGKRVKKIAVLLGEKLGLSDEEKEVLSWAAILHDIGRCIPHEEQEGEIDKHAVYGAELLPVEGMLGQIREAIYYHHERYDGSGIPEGLKYDQIPFISRIIAVADVYDAVVYINREDEEINHALGMAVIKRATGTLFDPLVVVAMEEIEENVKKVYEFMV